MIERRTKNKIYTVALLVLVCYMIVHAVYVYFVNPEGDTVYNDIVSVHFIDAGQADATLILGENFSMLIDSGDYESNAVIEYLRGNGIKALDYVVATHPHSDHIGGMADVISEFEITNFIMPDAVHTSPSFEYMIKALDKSDANVIQAKAGLEIEAGELKFELLGPISEFYENLNNYSVVIKLSAGNTSFLFAGDAEKAVEWELLNAGANLSADIYKASHHGSSTSSIPEFVEAINPRLAIISCGKDNSYGHPHRETLETFENFGIKVLRTDKNGTIIVYSDGEEISYGAER